MKICGMLNDNYQRLELGQMLNKQTKTTPLKCPLHVKPIKQNIVHLETISNLLAGANTTHTYANPVTKLIKALTVIFIT